MDWKAALRSPDLLSTGLWTRFNKPSLVKTLGLITGAIAAVDVILISIGMIIAAAIH